MSLQLAAQHLADKGRGPDRTLVHMSPREVAGLQALAMAHGGSLSINPETGLPEAGFLDNLLPTIIGAGLMFATGGAAGAAIIPGLSNAATIGLGLGALETARTGDLGKGIMAGLGAYGGAGLTAGLAGPGMAVANPQAAQIAAEQAGAASLAEQTAMQNAIAAQAAPGAGGIQSITLGDATTFPQIPESAFNVGSHIEDVNMLGAGTAPPTLATPEYGMATGDMGVTEADMRAYRSQLQPPTFAERFKAMPGKDLAKYGLAAAAPALLAEPDSEPVKVDNEQFRYAYSPGRVENPMAGYPADYRGEYAYFRPTFTRLADGGPVEAMSAANVYDMQNARGGVSDMGIDNSTGMQRMADGGLSGFKPLAGYGDENRYSYDPTKQSYTKLAPKASPLETVLALNTFAGGDGGYEGVTDPNPGLSAEVLGAANEVGISNAFGNADSTAAGPGGDVSGGYGGVDSGGYSGDGSGGYYAVGGLAALARGGMSHLGDYSDGGRLLKGPGDGVSDSIPAVIGQKRPARLADGEFVVPARIVSELGNGSTDAGARKLYAMMDRVQKARGQTTGKGKVAKNTRSEKYLPA